MNMSTRPTEKVHGLILINLVALTLSLFLSIVIISMRPFYTSIDPALLVAQLVPTTLLFSLSLTVLTIVWKGKVEIFGENILEGIQNSNEWISAILEEATPTERAVLLVSSVVSFSVLGHLPANPELVFLIFLSGFAFFYTVYTIDKKKELKKHLLAILPTEREIPIKPLRKMLNAEQKNVERAILDLMAEGYPLSYNYDTKIVSYNSAEPIRQPAPVVSHPSSPRMECAYCGEPAITDDAKFCTSCGASLIPAK